RPSCCPGEMVKMTKSKTFQAYLPNCHRTYSCIHCRAHLANHDELISKASGLCQKTDSTMIICCCGTYLVEEYLSIT
uniref:Yippee domain-containing protein n=1 Tax=Theropithecus gelada TaxID=9565 RepID=A0A8D2KB01_THEGE